MAETDALKGFDFGDVNPGSGTFLKFEAGKAVKLRVLTVDPVMSINTEYGNTSFGFIVYNFTEKKAQILSASPGVAKKIQAIHFDDDFGGNIRSVDIKITPTGEKLERRYEIQVLPTAEELTAEQVKEASSINLEGIIAKNAGWSKRLSMYDKDEYATKRVQFSGEEDTNGSTGADDEGDSQEPLGGTPIDPSELEDIPF